ncbi:endonuclease/exonuclease/phosphatase family protein [Pacificimonas sp. WHA3]|uniref:Endonuclease/exonuclease/phosphatase family protein n=1 Tax=Pacificimonas pallii TaxID=2827236 RepID=A0ABS6SDC1_9SPHN|nr:endonuclease/exonuclease/phosphatase family protein [Pacificimonas pallii]MBV7256418.1 endonuclease/exonuclease/phosphatase family protein [Pacificimonas pallii]
MFKVASYNIHKGIGLDRRRDPERILEVIAEIDADIIALQEADRRFFERRAIVDSQLLREGAGDYKHVSFDMREKSIGWHGNAIFVRDSAEILHAEPLWLETLEPRGAVLAEVDLGQGPLRIVGMHLDLSGMFRVKQVRGLIELIEGRRPMPTILMGDTNDWNQGRRAAMPTIPGQYRLASCGPSFHTRRPTLELDRIIYSQELDCNDCGVHTSALSKRASDHLPVWAKLRYRP